MHFYTNKADENNVYAWQYYDKWQHQGEFQKTPKSACQSKVESGGMNTSHISVQPNTYNKISYSNIEY